MSLDKEYAPIFESVRRLLPPEVPPPEGPDDPWTPPVDPQEYVFPLLDYEYDYWSVPEGRNIPTYELRKEELDPLIPDLMDFWARTKDWVDNKWGLLDAWFIGIETYIESLWNSITKGISDTGTLILDEITGIANYISNLVTWFTFNLVDDIADFAAHLFYPVTLWIKRAYTAVNLWLEEIWEAIINFFATPVDWITDLYADLAAWLSSIKDEIWLSLTQAADIVGSYVMSYVDPIRAAISDWLENIWESITNFWADPVAWIQDLFSNITDWLESIRDEIWLSMTTATDSIGVYLGTKLNEFAPVVVDLFRDAAVWLWDLIKPAFSFWLSGKIPDEWESEKGAWEWLREEFTSLATDAYEEIMDRATKVVPVTPERSAGIAVGMFGSAVAFGTTAHSMSLAVEAIPNLKYMGVHYLSAFIARMGSFGTISSATMGVIAALAIRKPFSYYMNSILRPTQPAAMDLQIMAVKPDIDEETFRQGMRYEGYSDFWIDAFQRTMYHEPSYFELSMLGEDHEATAEWIFTKARRRGYSEVDAEIFVRSLLKKVYRDQRKEFYMQSFNAFKEGYIDIDQFKENLETLDIRDEAKELSVRSANLAYQADLHKDFISSFKKAFQDDLITEDDLRTSLSTLGMIPERVDAIVSIEWVKKQPKILKAEQREVEKQWRDIQSKYSRLYIESFRKGLITESDLSTYLVAIGIEERAAMATATYEAVKKVPRPKPIEVVIPALPAPPTYPAYA